jgi:hypothetical protein
VIDEERLDAVEAQTEIHTQQISSLTQRTNQNEATSANIIVKMDQVVVALARMTAIGETAIAILKATPVVFTLAAALIGGLIWLIKHA